MISDVCSARLTISWKRERVSSHSRVLDGFHLDGFRSRLNTLWTAPPVARASLWAPLLALRLIGSCAGFKRSPTVTDRVPASADCRGRQL
jgi:hypothetical protein